MNFTEVLIPIVVSGVMPVAIVALIARIYIKKSEHRMNVMVKAIENGAELDQNALMGLKSKVKSTRKELVSRLGSGIMFTLLGLMFILSAAFGLSSFPSWGYYPGFPRTQAGGSRTGWLPASPVPSREWSWEPHPPDRWGS